MNLNLTINLDLMIFPLLIKCIAVHWPLLNLMINFNLMIVLLLMDNIVKLRLDQWFSDFCTRGPVRVVPWPSWAGGKGINVSMKGNSKKEESQKFGKNSSLSLKIARKSQNNKRLGENTQILA
jgi:hypothetical protein